MIFWTVQMLRGMALECYFKALWLKVGGTLVVDGRYQSIPGTRDHDLHSLALAVGRRAALQLTGDELTILPRLSDSITGGRYPIRRSPDPPKLSAPSSEPKWGMWRFPGDEKLLGSILVKLNEALGA